MKSGETPARAHPPGPPSNVHPLRSFSPSRHRVRVVKRTSSVDRILKTVKSSPRRSLNRKWSPPNLMRDDETAPKVDWVSLKEPRAERCHSGVSGPI